MTKLRQALFGAFLAALSFGAHAAGTISQLPNAGTQGANGPPGLGDLLPADQCAYGTPKCTVNESIGQILGALGLEPALTAHGQGNSVVVYPSGGSGPALEPFDLFIGQPNGAAGLDGNGHIPTAQLPAASTSAAGICQFGATAGTCVPGSSYYSITTPATHDEIIDSATVQNALNTVAALGGGIVHEPPGQIYYIGALSIPANTKLDCDIPVPDGAQSTNAAVLNALGGLRLDPTTPAGERIISGDGGGVIHCPTFPIAMTFPQASPANYAGTAFEATGVHGATFTDDLIIGFNTCLIVSSPRFYVVDPEGWDCNNTFQSGNSGLNGTTDSAELNLRQWPWGTAATPLPAVVDTSSITWSGGTVSVTTTTPHGIPNGYPFTMGCVSPVGYKGTYIATVTSPTTFTYPLANNPGAVTVQGCTQYTPNWRNGVTFAFWGNNDDLHATSLLSYGNETGFSFNAGAGTCCHMRIDKMWSDLDWGTGVNQSSGTGFISVGEMHLEQGAINEVLWNEAGNSIHVASLIMGGAKGVSAVDCYQHVGAAQVSIAAATITGCYDSIDLSQMSAGGQFQILSGSISGGAIPPYVIMPSSLSGIQVGAIKVALESDRQLFNPTSANIPPIGPLDLWPSSSAAACGVRLLNSKYTGPLLNLQRSSDDTNRDFYPDLTGGVSLPAIAAWAGDSTVTILKCYDQSGLGQDFVQATTADQPTFTLSQFGSVPAMCFAAGGAQALYQGLYGSTANMWTTNSGATMMAAVLPTSTPAAADELWGKGNSTLALISGSTLEFNPVMAFSTTTGSWTATNSTAAAHVVDMEFNASGTSPSTPPSLAIDGTAQTITTVQAPVGTYTSDSENDLVIGNSLANGSSRGFPGCVGEIEFWTYGGPPNAALLDAVRKNIGAYYGISVN